MTLIELRDRLNEIISENDRSEARRSRNNLPVRVSYRKSPRRTMYIPVSWVSSAQLGLPGGVECIEIFARSLGGEQVITMKS